MGRENRKTFYFIALFPSLFFWSSVIDKGTIIILGMSIYAYGTISWHKTKKHPVLSQYLAGYLLWPAFGFGWERL